MVRLFAAGPETGGVVYTKQAPMGNVSFATGRGDPFIKLASDQNINNPTSTKQSVNATSGLVVLASDQVTARYVHNTMSLGSPPPTAAPVAAFSGTPLSGTAPLSVSFTDQSTNSPTSWSWDFGDGGTATTQNPTHSYSTAGTYDVSLTATNSSGGDTVVKTGYVTVGDQPPPVSGGYPSTVIADNPAGYWRLGDSGTSVAAEAGPSGSAVGGVTSAPGAIVNDPDTARAFDGSTGYLSIPDASSLNPTGDLSVEAWVNPRIVHGGVAVQKGGSSGYSVWQYRLGMTSGGQWRGTVFVGGTAYAVTAPGTGALGTWTHLVLTRSAGTLSLYVNGALAATAASSGAVNSTTSILAVGRSGASASSYFDGSVDEVAVYDHALSASAVAAHKQGGRP
jgi:PKD repeat protein